MSFSNRSRFEIMADILQKAIPGAKKTWLLYSANLSYSQHQRYLRTLVDLHLILKIEGLYTTTEKGMAFIKSYQTLMDLLEEPFGPTPGLNETKVKDSKSGKLSASGDDYVEAKVLDARDV
jgi:predicted transcriptional regulator